MVLLCCVNLFKEKEKTRLTKGASMTEPFGFRRGRGCLGKGLCVLSKKQQQRETRRI